MGAIEDIASGILRIADVLERWEAKTTAPPMPGECDIRQTGESFFYVGDRRVDLIKFVVTVPEEATADVVKREVTVGDVTLEVAGRLAGETGEFKAEQDSTVVVSVVNVDDAGNKSPARVQSFQVLDTFAPPEPGEVGIRAVGEETV